MSSYRSCHRVNVVVSIVSSRSARVSLGFDDLVYDPRVGQRGDVAEIVDVAGGDFLQNSSHDLSASSLRQIFHDDDAFWRREGADFHANVRDEFSLMDFERRPFLDASRRI